MANDEISNTNDTTDGHKGNREEGLSSIDPSIFSILLGLKCGPQRLAGEPS